MSKGFESLMYGIINFNSISDLAKLNNELELEKV